MSKKLLRLSFILILLLVLPFSEKTPVVPNPNNYDLIIGVVSDLHIGGFGFMNWRKQALDKLSPAQFVIMLGDGVEFHQGSEIEFLELENLLNSRLFVPWRCIRGNHEERNTFIKHFGPTNWVQDVNGYRLIGIETNRIEIKFLQKALETEMPCLIFGHHNLEFVKANNRAKIRELIKENRVLAYISGHLHFFWAREDPDLKAQIIMCGWGQIGQSLLIYLKQGKIVKVEPR